jgi:hypothetical protein
LSKLKGNRFARVIAGTIELFCGAYFVTFGSLAILYFERRGNRMYSLYAAAGALFGLFLVLRADRLLGWHRGIFWILALAMLIVPIVWYVPALVKFR